MADTLEEKLKYLKLDLNKIPKFLTEFEPVDFRPSKLKEDNKPVVYKYVPVEKIQILITPKNRLEDIEQKYAKAVPLIEYIIPDKEENVERHAKFLQMLNQTKIEEIEEALKEQKQLEKKIPFEVKYDKSYAWQIYYSESTNKYFMMVPSEDAEYDKFLLTLKMQIESSKSRTKKESTIFVPINYLDYSEKFLKKSEIKDIENYLWLFTKDWANIYEVYDKDGEMTLQIIGKTNVYENIKSKYKIKLSSKEEAIAFYQYIKALFILQTELSMHYKFKTKINSKSELEFYYNNEKIKFENLHKFIEDEYIKLQKNDKLYNKQILEQKEKLIDLKKDAKAKEKEYFDKQRQIALYLECKRSFFGKVKYFLKRTPVKKVKHYEEGIIEASVKKAELNSSMAENENDNLNLETKTYYTIEDLVTLYYTTDKKQKELKNLELDNDALINKIENLKIKVNNADLYIQEIDKHKKSIFEFWKFANKDEQKALEVGNIENNKSKKAIKKVFKYEFDFDDFSVQMDKKQRIKLSKIEQDSAYIATTEIADVMNNIGLAIKSLEELKQEQEKNVKVYNFQEFDIFGNLIENRAKERKLGNQRHRENRKDKLKILSITPNTTLEEYINKINETKDTLEESFKKIKSPYDINLYAVSEDDSILQKEYVKYYINLESALKSSNLNEKEVDVYKIKLKENMPFICCTNIIFYDNFNKTLPDGMNEEETVLLKNSMYEFKENGCEEFKTNMYFDTDNDNMEVRKITVHEYDIFN